MKNMSKYIKNYVEYSYDQKDEGALIATADCDYYGFHAHAELVVHNEKYDIATFYKKCRVLYRNKKTKKLYRTNYICAYSDKDYEQLKKVNNLKGNWEYHFIETSINNTYEYYLGGK